MRDTTAEAEQVQLNAIRRQTPSERLDQALAFSHTMHELGQVRVGRVAEPHGQERRGNQPHLLHLICDRLDAAGIPFMITGSVAAAVHGAGRATMDIDVVIDPTKPQLVALVSSLADPDTYVSAEAALDALTHQSMFNVVHVATGWKADLIVRKDRPFSRGEFDRRQAVDFEGRQLWVVSVEDLIVAKLEWAKLGGSARQLEDVAALLRVAGDHLDAPYVERWIAELGLDAQWRGIVLEGPTPARREMP